MKTASVPIVVVAYNRPHLLRRLLGSLLRASYPASVKLYISLDEGGGQEILQEARKFDWPFGEKEVLAHEEHMGLKKHVMFCASLVKDHEAVIILEDDLFVSPAFYSYTLQALEFYSGNPGIAGISLYSHGYNETAQFPFQPTEDGSDVFFMQYAASWGQCWTRPQWEEFLEWLRADEHAGHPSLLQLPPNVARWPASSWKKHFIAFLIRQEKYFVYPRVSLTTNFSDEGQHMIRREYFLQRPLLQKEKRFHFVRREESGAVYDSYCEMTAACLRSHSPALREYDFETDLYGMKDASRVTASYMLTSMKCTERILHFGREMKPPEANIIHNIPGEHFSLARTAVVERKSYFGRLRGCSSADNVAYHLGRRFYHTVKGKCMMLAGGVLYHPRIYPVLARILKKGKW